jgi:uncharacterized protein (TIGR00156 family)
MFFKTLAVAMTLFFVATGAFAQFAGPGTTGGGATTVKQVLERPIEDMWVVLNGNILNQIGHELYMFSDGTGQIAVDIDYEYFPYNRTITPQTTVQIAGEVDVEYRGVKIDVKQIMIISDAGPAPQQQGGFKGN